MFAPLTSLLLGVERGSLGLAGHQPTSKFSEKPCVRGIRQRDRAGHLTPFASVYAHAYTQASVHIPLTKEHTIKKEKNQIQYKIA